MQVMDKVQMYAENPIVGRVYEVEGWRLESAEEHGIKIGRTEGIKIGRTEGIEIGKTEGITIGKKDQAIQTAKMMLGRNYSLDEISILTDLPKEELLNLR